MRRYKPSHRPDYRYILLENKEGIDIGKYLLEFFGIRDFGKLEFKMIGKMSQQETIRIERGMAQEAAAALLISSKRIAIKKISGTLNKLKK